MLLLTTAILPQRRHQLYRKINQLLWQAILDPLRRLIAYSHLHRLLCRTLRQLCSSLRLMMLGNPHWPWGMMCRERLIEDSEVRLTSQLATSILPGRKCSPCRADLSLRQRI